MNASLRILALASILGAGGAGAAVVDVTGLGARPDDDGNDLAAFREAARLAREQPGATLVIPSGRYVLRDEEAVRALEDIRSGRHGHDTQPITFVPYAPFVRAIDLTGARDVTVAGAGATLVYAGLAEGLTLTDCERVTVRGLTMVRDEGTHSEGRIVAVRPGSFDAVFAAEYPVHGQLPCFRVQFWDIARNAYSATHYYKVNRSEIAPQTLRFPVIAPVATGNVVTISHVIFSRPSIAVQESRDIVIEDVTVHGGGGNAVGGERVHNLTMRRLRVVPRPGRKHSTNVDATHFNNCTGLLRMEGCEIGGQEDDAINVHCYYHTLVARIDDTTCVTRVATSYGTHLNTLDYFSPGERVELVERDTARLVRTYRVKACVPDRQALRTRVTLDAPLPADLGGYYLTPADRFPRMELVGNTIFSHRARSFLVKSRDVLIESNRFEGATSTAIQCGAETPWWESGPVQRVVIRNNHFRGCGTGGEIRHGASAVSIELEAPRREHLVNRDVRIEDNVVEGVGNPCAFYIGHTEGAVVRGNRVAGCREVATIERSTNIVVEANQLEATR